MRNGRRIVDAHIHSFPYIDGISTRGKTQGTKNGRMLVNGVEESFIPEWLADSAFPIELALNYMDKEGVDQAFISKIVLLEIATSIYRKQLQGIQRDFLLQYRLIRFPRMQPVHLSIMRPFQDPTSLRWKSANSMAGRECIGI